MGHRSTASGISLTGHRSTASGISLTGNRSIHSWYTEFLSRCYIGLHNYIMLILRCRIIIYSMHNGSSVNRICYFVLFNYESGFWNVWETGFRYRVFGLLFYWDIGAPQMEYDIGTLMVLSSIARYVDFYQENVAVGRLGCRRRSYRSMVLVIMFLCRCWCIKRISSRNMAFSSLSVHW